MRRIVYLAAGICLVSFGFSPVSLGAVFTDSTRANVLREYNPATGVKLVGAAISGFNVQTPANSNEGSGAPDQWQIAASDGAQTGTVTYTLPGPRLVGSFKADFNPSHVPTGGFVLEGFTGGSWVTLSSVGSVTGTISGTFTPTTVTALRYIVTGPGTGDKFIQNTETQVYLSSGQTVDHTAGYNVLRDVVNASATTDSATSGPWRIRTSAGAGNSSHDANYFAGHIHSGSSTPAQRSFFTLSFTGPFDITAGHLGWFNGQQWNNYEIYSTDALTLPATQSLTSADPATIQAAGWDLEFASGGFQQRQFFRFNHAFDRRHVFVVWDGPGALVEMELYVPEPASLVLLSAAGLFVVRRPARSFGRSR